MRIDRLSELYLQYSSWFYGQAPLYHQNSSSIPVAAEFEWSEVFRK